MKRLITIMLALILSAGTAFADPPPESWRDYLLGRPAATTPAGTNDLMPIIQGGSVKKITPSGLGISGAYTLPTASPTTLGGVKVGSGLSINNGVLSATATSGELITSHGVKILALPGGTCPSGWKTTYASEIAQYTAIGYSINNIICVEGITVGSADTTAPVVTAFTLPSTASSVTVAVNSFTATDAVGVTGYQVTESTTPPTSWSGSTPTQILASGAGSKTFYPWAKDAAGNVSAVYGTPQTVVITLPDTTPPVVSTFTMPSSASSLTLSISSYTVTDAVGVTGYLVTESSTPPSSGAGGWSGSAPTQVTASGMGSKTFYPWAKDAAGNVSAVFGTPRTVTITDTTAPVVSVFTMTSSASSLVVAVNSFTASDNVGVTGYLVTESSTPPTSGAGGWSGSAPTQVTASGSGSKTFYPWAKDAAGNVSAVFGTPQTVTITIADITSPVVTAFTMPATATALNVSVSSFTASDNVAVTGYLINESSTPPAASVVSGGSAPTTYSFASVGSHTTYPWVRDAAGNVSAVFGSPRTTVVTTTPNGVTGLGATGGNTQVTVSWTNSASDSTHSAPTDYTIIWGTSAGSLSNTITTVTSPYIHTGRTNGATYYYSIVANNSGGSITVGPVSAAATAPADSTPDQFTFTDQTGVALSSTITSAAITVAGINTASAISISGGTYDINGSGTFVSSAGTVNVGDTVRARHTSSGSYSTAVNTTVTIGGVSDIFTSTTIAQPAPTQPVITVTPGDMQNVIALASGGSGATSYNIKWGTVSGTRSNTTSGVTLPYTHTGRTNGTPYYYSLVAVNGGGSTESAEVSGTPAGAVSLGSKLIDGDCELTAALTTTPIDGWYLGSNAGKTTSSPLNGSRSIYVQGFGGTPADYFDAWTGTVNQRYSNKTQMDSSTGDITFDYASDGPSGGISIGIVFYNGSGGSIAARSYSPVMMSDTLRHSSTFNVKAIDPTSYAACASIVVTFNIDANADSVTRTIKLDNFR